MKTTKVEVYFLGDDKVFKHVADIKQFPDFIRESNMELDWAYQETSNITQEWTLNHTVFLQEAEKGVHERSIRPDDKLIEYYEDGESLEFIVTETGFMEK